VAPSQHAPRGDIGLCVGAHQAARWNRTRRAE